MARYVITLQRKFTDVGMIVIESDADTAALSWADIVVEKSNAGAENPAVKWHNAGTTYAVVSVAPLKE